MMLDNVQHQTKPTSTQCNRRVNDQHCFEEPPCFAARPHVLLYVNASYHVDSGFGLKDYYAVARSAQSSWSVVQCYSPTGQVLPQLTM